MRELVINGPDSPARRAAVAMAASALDVEGMDDTQLGCAIAMLQDAFMEGLGYVPVTPNVTFRIVSSLTGKEY